ncbi:MAG: hypothetical protein LBS77_00565 [Desulfovibrio sp.]|jgi:hypothetical protein|nr:hypothetical protein [Desulfovibrio sp.]
MLSRVRKRRKSFSRGIKSNFNRNSGSLGSLFLLGKSATNAERLTNSINQHSDFSMPVNLQFLDWRMDYGSRRTFNVVLKEFEEAFQPHTPVPHPYLAGHDALSVLPCLFGIHNLW